MQHGRAEHEALRKLIDQGVLTGHELGRNEGVPGGAVFVVEAHAAGIVDEHTEEVLLRHHGGNHEGGLQKGKDHQAQQAQSEARHDAPIGRAASAPGQCVGGDRCEGQQAAYEDQDSQTGGRGEGAREPA